MGEHSMLEVIGYYGCHGSLWTGYGWHHASMTGVSTCEVNC